MTRSVWHRRYIPTKVGETQAISSSSEPPTPERRPLGRVRAGSFSLHRVAASVAAVSGRLRDPPATQGSRSVGGARCPLFVFSLQPQVFRDFRDFRDAKLMIPKLFRIGRAAHPERRPLGRPVRAGSSLHRVAASVAAVSGRLRDPQRPKGRVPLGAARCSSFVFSVQPQKSFVTFVIFVTQN